MVEAFTTPKVSTRNVLVRRGATATTADPKWVGEIEKDLVKVMWKEGDGIPLKEGDVATIKYSCYLPNTPPFTKSDAENFVSLCNDTPIHHKVSSYIVSIYR